MKQQVLSATPLKMDWLSRDQAAFAGDEKTRVLNENLAEISELCQYAFDDAVLMGCSEHTVRKILTDMIASLKSPQDFIGRIVWIGRDGMPIGCEEKIRILTDNLREIFELCQYALGDAMAAGCSEHHLRMVLSDMIASLKTPYAKSA